LVASILASAIISARDEKSARDHSHFIAETRSKRLKCFPKKPLSPFFSNADFGTSLVKQYELAAASMDSSAVFEREA
jgi:hypothetical protein